MSNNNENTLATRIESRIDKTVARETGLTQSGAMAFASIEQIMEFAKLMAIAGVAIPKHLRENVGACMAIAVQASEWSMSPFAVASKTYVVNDRVAFEAQLINAVILRRAPIKGRFKIAYTGEGPKRRCRVSVTLLDGEEVDYESPEIGSIPVKNSPLWKADPDQQLFYASSRAMCRRHFPDVILGIYTPDEMSESTDIEATVTPLAPIFAAKEAPKQIAAEKPVEKPQERSHDTAQGYVDIDPPAEEPAPEGDPLPQISALLAEHGASEDALMVYLVGSGLAKKTQQLGDLSEKKLRDIVSNFPEIVVKLSDQ